ncbi:hypothetical protein ACI6QG_17510 [Roseococcus sp. DSY-14]|uniref:hypothetical protein n=1 Tax=Roseococcus sp. DSY-14 TaxID=3369650 RepID=UPI00387AE1F3
MDHAAVSALRARLLSAAAKRIPKAAAASCARALGLWRDEEVKFTTEAQFLLVLDLGVFAPPGGHTPALAREARQPHDAEEAAVLAALADARFTLFRLGAAHPEGGARAEDLLRGTEIRLRDDRLQQPEFEGVAFAGRLMRLDGLDWTCGAVAPLTDEVLEELLGRPVARPPAPRMLPPLTPPAPEDLAVLRAAALAEDFAARTYRAALDHGLLGKRP